jgi:cbb3-type cytochrome oxidase maturation protein
MSLVSVLIPVTLVLVGFGVWAFFWAVRSGQFEELDVAAWEILVDEQRDATEPLASPTDIP